VDNEASNEDSPLSRQFVTRRFEAKLRYQPVVKVRRRTEAGDAPGWQAATSENTGTICERGATQPDGMQPPACGAEPPVRPSYCGPFFLCVFGVGGRGSLVGFPPISGRGSMTKPARFGIFTCGSVV
jgi:hypothetical protein